MSGALFFLCPFRKNKKTPENPARKHAIRELQAGQHGRVVLVMQIGANLAGLGTAVVERREEEVGAAQNEGNKENRHHKKGLAFRILQDGVKGGLVGSAFRTGAIIARKMPFVYHFF